MIRKFEIGDIVRLTEEARNICYGLLGNQSLMTVTEFINDRLLLVKWFEGTVEHEARLVGRALELVAKPTNQPTP